MPFFKRKQIDPLSLQKLKQNLQINFEPANAKPVTYYKSVEIHRTKSKHFWRMGYVSDFMQTGEPGVFVHGSPEGFFILPDLYGRQDFVLLSPAEFYHHLVTHYSIDLSKDKQPLHLVCCYSGAAKENSAELSIVQQLANILHRKIWSYGGHEQVYYYGKYQGLVGMINNVGEIHIHDENKFKKARPMLVTPHFDYS